MIRDEHKRDRLIKKLNGLDRMIKNLDETKKSLRMTGFSSEGIEKMIIQIQDKIEDLGTEIEMMMDEGGL